MKQQTGTPAKHKPERQRNKEEEINKQERKMPLSRRADLGVIYSGVERKFSAKQPAV